MTRPGPQQTRVLRWDMLRALPVVLVPFLLFAACDSEPEPSKGTVADAAVTPIDGAPKAPRDASADSAEAAPSPPYDASPRPRDRCDVSEGHPLSIVPGHYYDEHVVVSATSRGAPQGNYNFTNCRQDGANWVRVDLVRDGARIDQFDVPTYEIMAECAGEDNTIKIGFAGYFEFEMAALRGSRNLYGICETIFDGNHVYTVL